MLEALGHEEEVQRKMKNLETTVLKKTLRSQMPIPKYCVSSVVSFEDIFERHLLFQDM